MNKLLDDRSGIDIEATLMTINEFHRECKNGSFIDYDGFGYFCTDLEQTELRVYPSLMNELVAVLAKSLGMTQINWYNR